MKEQLQVPHRDGASQAGRIQKALDPEYIRVDERSIMDLLAFAGKYSRELRYFNEHNEADGDWSDILSEHDLSVITAYINDPKKTKIDESIKPHLVLFVTFLELLQHARIQMNDLTRKHLEFYYQEALRLTLQKGAPDRVHALVELANGQGEFRVPARTLFQAGQDSQGNDLFYRSDEDLVANQASVSSLKSLFAEKQVIGIREARLNPGVLIELFPENASILDGSFMAMLVMALGTPSPGGELEPYPDDRNVGATLLEYLDNLLLDFIPLKLKMSVSTFRFLMQLKNDLTVKKNPEITKQWKDINDILEEAGKKRKPDFILDRSVSDDFEKNFLSALGRSEWGDLFKTLPDVDNIYDLYRNLGRADVHVFIGESKEGDSVKIGPTLYMSVADFEKMMRIVEEINGRWRQMYEILRAAGKKKNPAYTFKPPEIRKYEPDKLKSLVEKTLGIDFVYPVFNGVELANFDDCYAEIIKLEYYFHMPAEKFVFIRMINRKINRKINAEPKIDVQPWEWEQVYAILEDAHAEKKSADRRKELRDKHNTGINGFNVMILFALGDPDPGNALPDYSKKFLELDADKEDDKKYIREKLFLAPENFSYIKNNHGMNLNDPKWENVYAILEQAQRRKRKFVMPLAQVERWENVYIAEDASRIQVRMGVESESVTPRWRTFGEGYYPQPDGQVRTVPGAIGFAIASPLLLLAEGERTITLTLDFHEEGFDADAIGAAIGNGMNDTPPPFRFLLSTEKEMLAIDQVIDQDKIEIKLLATSSQHALQFKLTLNPQVPPITPLTMGTGIQTPWPVLQIMLADIQQDERPVKRYRAFQSLKLEKIHLQVTVDGITSLTLQNDDGTLNSKKPFEPFGIAPVVGSSFYMAHPELCSKKLDELRLNIDWFGVPDNLSAHYLGYAPFATPTKDKPTSPAVSPIADNTVFEAKLWLHDNRSSFEVRDNIRLFNNDDADPKTGAKKTSKINVSQTEITNEYKNYGRDLQPVIASETLDWRRYWQVELGDRDFLHAAYPNAAAESAKRVKMDVDVTKPDPYIINPPYTPKIKKLSAGYTASVEIDLAKEQLASVTDQFFHLEPFGYRQLMDATKPVFFVPQFENEGELYIGVSDLKPPQNLSLLFQMAEGSADPDVEREAVQWSYLDANQWETLEDGQLLGDTTNGLLNSGILQFSLTPVEPSSLLPNGFYWIRAVVPKNSRSIADTVAIKAQAVSATFEDHNNAPDHLSQPLAAESIRGLAESQPQVKAIHQPYSSYGGKSAEQAGKFYTRVSERLRHKDRALTSWDYEHMVLEAFPGIYKVKCLPVGSSEDPGLADVVQVVVIPDIRGKLPFDPFEPKAPADVLSQIEKYLIQHSPPDAQLKVKNPTYIQIELRLNVRFREGSNPGYDKQALNRDLQQYLSPWAYDQSADIYFGGSIKKNLIVNFVEERRYVDYVAGVEIFTIGTDGKPSRYTEPGPTESGTAFAPDAILVSARSHHFDPIPEEGYEEQFFTGINYMKIGLDFVVG